MEWSQIYIYILCKGIKYGSLKGFVINDKVKHGTFCSIDSAIHSPSEVTAYAQSTIKSRLDNQDSVLQDSVPADYTVLGNLHLKHALLR